MGKILMTLMASVLSGLWRRGFGCDFWDIPVLKIRATQHVLAGVILFALFYFYKDLSLLWSVYAIAVIQGLFWAGGHGAAFDISRGGTPDETLVKRYNEVWFAPALNFLVPQKDWYGFGYDFLWMAFRYTGPLVLLVPVFGWTVLLLGLMVALVYAGCWSWSERRSLPFDLGPTQGAELIAGALAGVMWVML